MLLGKKNQELRIRRITEYSGGSFKCYATNERGQVWSQGQLTVQCKYFRFEIYLEKFLYPKFLTISDASIQFNATLLLCLVPPKWIKSFPDTIELAFENRFELVCNSTGIPRPTFIWYQNGTRIFNE